MTNADEQTYSETAEWIARCESDNVPVEYELIGRQGLPVRLDFKHPVELKLGRDSQTSSCFLIDASVCPQLRAEYIIAQPDVVRRDPARGWIPIGGYYEKIVDLGREASPQLRLGPDVSREHCYVSISRTLIDISTYGRNGTRILMWPSDLAADVDEFNQSV